MEPRNNKEGIHVIIINELLQLYNCGVNPYVISDDGQHVVVNYPHPVNFIKIDVKIVSQKDKVEDLNNAYDYAMKILG